MQTSCEHLCVEGHLHKELLPQGFFVRQIISLLMSKKSIDWHAVLCKQKVYLLYI